MQNLLAQVRQRTEIISPVVFRLFLAVVLAGLAGSIPEVIFNFYVQSLGYDNSVAGQLAGLVRLSGFVFGIPIGLLVDRFGGVRAIQLGATLNTIVWLVLVQTTDLNAMRALYFLAGVFASSVMVGTVPTLVRIVPPANRARILGLNFSLFVIMGFAGALLGGFLPGAYAQYAGVPATSAEAYRFVLYMPIVLSALALLPLASVQRRLTQGQHDTHAQPTHETEMAKARVPYILLITTCNMLMGFAGGMIHPFFNLFLRQTFALEDAVVGSMVAGLSLALGLGGMFGKPIADAMGPRRGVMVLALVAGLLGMGTLIPNVWAAFVCYALSTFAVGMLFPFFDLLILPSVPVQQRGLAKSTASMQWSIGWASAAFVSGFLQLSFGFVVPIAIYIVGQFVVAALVLVLPYRAPAPAPAIASAT